MKEAKLSTTGEGTYPSASNVLQASGQMTVAGTLAAGDRNRLEYRANPPMIVAGAAITPEAEIVQNGVLPCCEDGCTPTTTTTTSTTPGSTSTTTTSTAPPTATTSTSTTVLVTPSTSTSTVPSTPTTISTTTSTVPPDSCLDQPPESFEMVSCTLDRLSKALDGQSPESLGGTKMAKALTSRIGRVEKLITTARSKTKPVPILQRAKKQLRMFRALALRGTRRSRIAPDVGEKLLALASESSTLIDGLRTSIQRAAR